MTPHINVVLEKAANTDLPIRGEVHSKGTILSTLMEIIFNICLLFTSPFSNGAEADNGAKSIIMILNPIVQLLNNPKQRC